MGLTTKAMIVGVINCEAARLFIMEGAYANRTPRAHLELDRLTNEVLKGDSIKYSLFSGFKRQGWLLWLERKGQDTEILVLLLSRIKGVPLVRKVDGLMGLGKPAGDPFSETAHVFDVGDDEVFGGFILFADQGHIPMLGNLLAKIIRVALGIELLESARPNINIIFFANLDLVLTS